MKIEILNTSGFEGAILGMRLPMCKNLDEVKEKSKSTFGFILKTLEYTPLICLDDLRICKNLINADSGKSGQPNSKFLRMIHCQLYIEAPMYWWKEFDTYKIGTVRNSSSTMHKLASTPITIDCFEMDDIENVKISSNKNKYVTDTPLEVVWKILIDDLERLRQIYNETKDKRYWKELIRLLPESWLQNSVVDLNYETLRNIYHWRKNHKLTEWHKFCEVIEKLPYAEELIIGVNEE